MPVADERALGLGVGALAGPVRFFARPFMHLLFGAYVEGVEHVPADGPAIIAANHRSFFDTPLIMAMAPRPVAFLGTSGYMEQPIARHVFPAVGLVPVPREDPRGSAAALETAADLLASGRLVGIYPEGTRSPDGLLHRGHTGVAHLALRTGAPIVPVGLIGTERIQPVGARIPRPNTGRVEVRFGEPIDPAPYRAGGSRTRRRHLLRDVMAAIAALSGQERSADFSSDEAPLIRGGSESVYRVRSLSADGLSWRHAAERVVADAGLRFDDSRVGEVATLRCRVLADGGLRFETELSLTTKFRGGTS